MRHWKLDTAARAVPAVGTALASMIDQLGKREFDTGVLRGLHPLVPAASWSVYRTGHRCRPALFLSGSLGIPDTTRDCWRAYLTGPHLSDKTLRHDVSPSDATSLLSHITAGEVPVEHRARVYEAHGVAERLSIVQRENQDAIFAINFYRHTHQRPFTDAQIAAFESLAPALLALTTKHIALAVPVRNAASGSIEEFSRRLLALQPDLTPRETDVCARLLQGMTHEGIAADLGLGLPTVKTYRNRAFARLGIHFRNEMFAMILDAPQLH